VGDKSLSEKSLSDDFVTDGRGPLYVDRGKALQVDCVDGLNYWSFNYAMSIAVVSFR
jgi:hypothetical protein